MIKGIIGAVIGGAIGATLWALIVYFTNSEVGIIAWAVGAMAGAGMMLGARDIQSPLCGVIAAFIALASIAGGKYAVVQTYVSKDTAQFQRDFVITEDYTKLYVADQLVEEYTREGKTLKWPEGYDAESAEEPHHYPPALWKDAEERWSAMSDEQKSVYYKALEANMKEFVKHASADATAEGFIASFSFWDVLWGVLAVPSAYKIGSGQGGDE
ncbi:MAG: hypothetical protein KGS45_06595 [Planctomycetes bacterium]|nr:hypothetical protein [Planctomycetota bacterium]